MKWSEGRNTQKDVFYNLQGGWKVNYIKEQLKGPEWSKQGQTSVSFYNANVGKEPVCAFQGTQQKNIFVPVLVQLYNIIINWCFKWLWWSIILTKNEPMKVISHILPNLHVLSHSMYFEEK